MPPSARVASRRIARPAATPRLLLLHRRRHPEPASAAAAAACARSTRARAAPRAVAVASAWPAAPFVPERRVEVPARPAPAWRRLGAAHRPARAAAVVRRVWVPAADVAAGEPALARVRVHAAVVVWRRRVAHGRR